MATAGSGVRLRASPPDPRPGDVVVVRITGPPSGLPDGLEGEWAGRPLRLFADGDGLSALVGVDLDTPAGSIGWRLDRPGPGGGRLPVVAGRVAVRARVFETQRLTLPPGQVDLDAPTLARVQAEQAEMRATLARSEPTRLWAGAFRRPVAGGRPTGGFGLRRVINGQPRSPHTGFDWAAPVGTPVVAVASGRATLVTEYFFAGRLVVLDHGLGLFTLYFHLDRIDVSAGDPVPGGQAIGVVGSTGRVTGPHLHLGVVLDGARVDPESLLAVRPSSP